MAWTTIPDANLAPDAPARSIDALALRDNPIAIANGDSGAPRVVNGGISAGATNSWAMDSSGAVYQTAQTTYAGIGTFNASGTSIGVRVFCEGTVRVRFLHRSTAVGGDALARILLNGVQQVEYTNTTTSNEVREYDMSVVYGDVILIQQRTTDAGDLAEWSNHSVRGDIHFPLNSGLGV